MIKIEGFIHKCLIGLAMVSLCSGVYLIFINSVSENYDKDFDSSDLSVFNQTKEIRNITNQFEEQTANLKAESGLFDILGYMYSSSFGVLKLTFKGIGIFGSMVTGFFGSDGISTGLGEYGGLFSGTLIMILTIVVVLAVIGALIKWRL